MKDELIDLRNKSGANVFVRNWWNLWFLAEGFWRLSKCLKKSCPIVTSLPPHTFMWFCILFPSARESKISKPIQLYARRQSKMRSQEFTILSKTSHKNKNRTEVYLAVCFALLLIILNIIWCIIVKHIFGLLIFVPKWRQSSVFYCSVMIGHDVLLKATSAPRHKTGSEPLG